MSVGYQRRRSAGVDRWEAHVSTLGLLVAGAAITVLIVLLVARFISGGVLP